MKKIIMEDEEILATVFPEGKEDSSEHVGDGQAINVHKGLESVIANSAKVMAIDVMIEHLKTYRNEFSDMLKNVEMWKKARAHKIIYKNGKLMPIYKP